MTHLFQKFSRHLTGNPKRKDLFVIPIKKIKPWPRMDRKPWTQITATPSSFPVFLFFFRLQCFLSNYMSHHSRLLQLHVLSTLLYLCATNKQLLMHGRQPILKNNSLPIYKWPYYSVIAAAPCIAFGWSPVLENTYCPITFLKTVYTQN